MPVVKAGARDAFQSAAGEVLKQQVVGDRWPLPGEGRSASRQSQLAQSGGDPRKLWLPGAAAITHEASQPHLAAFETAPSPETSRNVSTAASGAKSVQTQPAGSRTHAGAEQSLLLVEAHKSRVDAILGALRCRACGKELSSYAVLAQHLRDKHNGINSPEPPPALPPRADLSAVSSRDKALLTLGDIMQVKQSAPAAQAGHHQMQSRRELKFSSKQLNQVRGLLKAHPTKEALAAALKQRMGASSSHRPSRLKRIILRERMDKSVAQATAQASSMQAFAASLRAQYQDLLQQLQESDELSRAQGDQAGTGGSGDVTHTQLLQAIAQTQYQLKAAELAAEEAEGRAQAALLDLAKINAPQQLDHGSEPDEPQSAAVQPAAAPRPALQPALPGGTADVAQQATAHAEHAEPPEHAEHSEHSGHAQHSQQAVHAYSFRTADNAADPEAHGPAADSAAELSDSDSDVDSLESFEDVLATWLHASQEQSPHFLSRDQLGQSWAADADRYAAEEAGAAARALSAALPTAAVEEPSIPDEDSESEISPEGWNNVLAAWMEASGITQSAESGSEAGLTLHAADMRTYAPGMPAMSSPATYPSSPIHAFASVAAPPSQQQMSAMGEDGRLDAFQPTASLPWRQQQQQQQQQLQHQGGSVPGQQPVLSILPQAQLMLSDSLPVMATPQADRSTQALLSRLQPRDSLLNPFAAGPPGMPEGPAASWLAGQEAPSGTEQHAADAFLPWRHQSWPLHQQAAMQPLPLQPGATYSAPVMPTVSAQPYMPLQHRSQAQPQVPAQPPPPPPRPRELIHGKSGAGGGIDPQLLDPTLGAYPQRSDMSALRLGSLPGNPAMAGMQSLGPSRHMSADAPASRHLHGMGSPGWADQHHRATSHLNPLSQQYLPPQHLQQQQQQHIQQQQPQQPDQLYPADAQPLGMSHVFPRQATTFPPTTMRRQELWQQAALSNLGLQSGQLSAVLDSANAGLTEYDMRAAEQQLFQDTHFRQSMGQELGLDMSLGQGLTAAGPVGHELHCQVCGVTCCGAANYEQHCLSRRHQRKMATAASANFRAAGDFASKPAAFASLAVSGGSPPGEAVNTTTYVGPQAQCRNYCQQVISTELNRMVGDLLQQLLFWQERQKANAPLKMKKRLVSGLREVAKAVRMRKVQTVIVAPNIEQIESEGGLDDLLASILAQADQSRTPVVFALSRKKLGQVFGCRKKMSAIAVLDASGAEELYQQMQHLALQGRLEWQQHHGQGAAGQLAGLSLQDQQQQLHDVTPAMEADPQAPPMMYQTRRDGRVVPVTSGFALEFARSKGMFPPA